MKRVLRHVRVAGVVSVGALLVGLAACGPSYPVLDLDSPVGTWRAAPPATGTLEVLRDGTFTITGSSFNISTARDAIDQYDAEGTWQVSSSLPELFLFIVQATDQGRPQSGNGGRSPDYKQGTITFRDGEDTTGVTFVYSQPLS
ncbi:hypothetical protein [Microbacterium nymphoidis]|uniref:hypothetical protein n=1 Tax=Microbacterium nymphoidis TaxID=2898586 RepID=UPI001E35565E|nr:hypothetical protein [Microbacterium nymphoidis]MCD2498016.1 hypothetical protein [Microbacterium nymphoidis]